MMYHVLLIIQYLSILILLFEAGYIFAKWRIALHGYLFFNCVATLVNNTGYLLEMLAKTEREYLMATQLSYLGRVWIPFSLLVFMLAVCKIKMPRWGLIGLACFHAVTFLLVLTAQWQPLYYSSFTYVEEGLFPIIEYGHGIWHNVYMAVLSFYIIFGMYQLFKTVHKEKHPVAKRRLMFVVASIAVESAFFFVNMTGITGNYDITVMGYTLSSIFMYIAIFKYDLLDTLQLAKDYVVDEVSEGIIAVNKDNRVEYVNRTAQMIFDDFHEKEDAIISQIQEAISSEQPLNIGEKIYSAKEKELVYNDMPQGKVYVLVDDTAHYRYMEELKEQKEIAEAANASKSRFLSIVSHEIRTPMNAVVGMTEMLLRDELTPKQRKYMTNIKNSGSALVMIINDILDQSKLEAGKMEIVEDAYELLPLVDDVQMIMEERIGKKPIHLMVQMDDRLPKVLVGDALRIRQILINLMNNAVKFTDSGYILLSAQIMEELPESYRIRFGVKDSGQGIREEDLKKLGEAFSQVDTKKNHKKEGTGLGLSISKDFIALMGGELKVESTYGKGSEFFFVIEQKKADEQSEEQCANKCAWKQKGYTAPEARVLIVDDTDLNLLITEEILDPLQLQIDTASSGEQAIELIQKNSYHAVFMDYMMPVMDGVETTGRIRKLAVDETDTDRAAYYKALPIIALTGDTSERTQELFTIAGINDFTEKPVEFKKLAGILLKWLPKELIRE